MGRSRCRHGCLSIHAPFGSGSSGWTVAHRWTTFGPTGRRTVPKHGGEQLYGRPRRPRLAGQPGLLLWALVGRSPQGR
eukprot:8718425-Alexandrium_andersonii.AAC.1